MILIYLKQLDLELYAAFYVTKDEIFSIAIVQTISNNVFFLSNQCFECKM